MPMMSEMMSRALRSLILNDLKTNCKEIYHTAKQAGKQKGAVFEYLLRGVSKPRQKMERQDFS
jgi:hypothetical protein